MLLGEQPLGRPKIGATHHADLTTCPGLLDDPVDRIDSIAGFIDQRGELALGGKPPPAILNDDHISLLHSSYSIDRGLREPAQRLFVIGQAREKHRERPLRVGTVHISGKFHRIAHGDHDVFLNQNAHGCPRDSHREMAPMFSAVSKGGSRRAPRCMQVESHKAGTADPMPGKGTWLFIASLSYSCYNKTENSPDGSSIAENSPFVKSMAVCAHERKRIRDDRGDR